MKKILFCLLPIALLAIGCKYDDSEIRNQLAAQKQRIAELEKKVTAANNSIASLQELVARVTALESKDYVTGVTSVTNPQTGEPGWTITFTKSAPITFYNGHDGSTPVVTVKQDGDKYYWQVNGQYLLDANNNPIQASAVDGKDGITPVLSIDETTNHWIVTYGDQQVDLGEVSANLSGVLFSSVVVDVENEVVVFTYKDTALGSFTLPLAKEVLKLQVTIDDSKLKTIAAGDTVYLAYTMIIPEEVKTVEMDAYATNSAWKVIHIADSETTGRIRVIAPDPLVDTRIVVVLNGDEGSNFVRTVKYIADATLETADTLRMDSKGGNVSLGVVSNADFTVTIPTNCDWVFPTATAGVVRVMENGGYDERSVTLTVKAGATTKEVVIIQHQLDAIIVSKELIEVDFYAQPIEVAVNTNVTFNVTSDAGWLTFVETKGLVGKTVSLTATENETDANRSATVTLTSEDTKTVSTFQVYQYKKPGPTDAGTQDYNNKNWNW